MKKAFTLLEIVFVIVIIGILAAVLIPRTSTNRVGEAAVQVLSHIRYTQHLAMIDDKFDPNDATWFREKWQIEFRSGVILTDYRIFSDRDQNGNVDIILNEAAIDPMTSEPLNSASSVTNLRSKFGITDVVFSANCRGNGTGKELNFDFIGRPYFYETNTTASATAFLLTADCDITLVGADGNATIRVTPETGYARII